MRIRFSHLRKDERGMALVYVSLGFMGFLTATTLAIDVGMFMTARSQAQNAADAGAHAGAVALALNSYTDRTTDGPAVQGAVNSALANPVMGATPSVFVTDVTFPLGPTGANNRVQVYVYRNVARGNPVPTLFGALFGVPTVDISATAIGEASPADAMTCVKPFMIPDKWQEKVDSKGVPDGSWTTSSDFDEFDNRNNPLPNPDVYIPAGTPGYTGYSYANDVGTALTLRAGNGSEPNPSFYYSWKMPNDIGGNFYRDNIDSCNTSIMTYRADQPTMMIQEPGDKQGPTVQGIQNLIDQDPGTSFQSAANGGCNCVVGSRFGTSPRVFPIPLFNPQVYAEGKANGRGATFQLANFLGFYADYVDASGGIHGIITNIVGLVDPNAGPAPADMFAKAIRLVQ